MSDHGAQQDTAGFDFAEQVRQAALRISGMVHAGHKEKAIEALLTLCTQAAERKREILGVVAPAPADDDVYTDPDNDWNLAELEKLGSGPSPE
jgi:hypothetical protein